MANRRILVITDYLPPQTHGNGPTIILAKLAAVYGSSLHSSRHRHPLPCLHQRDAGKGSRGPNSGEIIPVRCGFERLQVIVFSTAYEANKETSFDHPNIPAVLRPIFMPSTLLRCRGNMFGGSSGTGRQVVNPFNMKNRIGYTPGARSSQHGCKRDSNRNAVTREVKLAWFLGAHTWDVVLDFDKKSIQIWKS